MCGMEFMPKMLLLAIENVTENVWHEFHAEQSPESQNELMRNA